jgi:hypothetical protein
MAKRSRRARRQRTKRQRQNVPGPPPPEAAPARGITNDAAASIQTTDESQSVSRKTVDFLHEYLYVYRELRNILIIAVLMFAVLIGLSYII